MNYNYKYIDEAAKSELEGLVAGEHGKVVEAWTSECVNAGYRKGLAYGAVVAIIGTAVGYAVRNMRNGVVERVIQRNVDQLIRRLDVTKK